MTSVAATAQKQFVQGLKKVLERPLIRLENSLIIIINSNSMPEYVWIFNGENSRFASGIFKNIEKAEEWILTNKLSGILTKYPLDIGVYEWAIQNGLFSIKKEEQKQPEFIGKFSSGSQDHFHYENGVRE